MKKSLLVDNIHTLCVVSNKNLMDGECPFLRNIA